MLEFLPEVMTVMTVELLVNTLTPPATSGVFQRSDSEIRAFTGPATLATTPHTQLSVSHPSPPARLHVVLKTRWILIIQIDRGNSCTA